MESIGAPCSSSLIHSSTWIFDLVCAHPLLFIEFSEVHSGSLILRSQQCLTRSYIRPFTQVDSLRSLTRSIPGSYPLTLGLSLAPGFGYCELLSRWFCFNSHCSSRSSMRSVAVHIRLEVLNRQCQLFTFDTALTTTCSSISLSVLVSLFFSEFNATSCMRSIVLVVIIDCVNRLRSFPCVGFVPTIDLVILLSRSLLNKSVVFIALAVQSVLG